MMALISHPASLKHDNGLGHPESPARIIAIQEQLESGLVQPGLAKWVEAPLASDDDVRLAHGPNYIAKLKSVDAQGGGWLDPDTHLGPGSLEAAYRAAGAAVLAAERAMAGKGPSFSVMRPPGHHATPTRAMGFCMLSNAAIAGLAALERFGAERVLIVDWDVHHGNGTADVVRDNPKIRYVSLHQWPFYPGTGLADDVGCGNLFHVPRPPGLPAATYVRDLLDAVGNATKGWSPSLVIHSAGFDAMRNDPLGGFTLEPEDYGVITRQIRQITADSDRVCSVLEGGYDPQRIALAALEHVKALAE